MSDRPWRHLSPGRGSVLHALHDVMTNAYNHKDKLALHGLDRDLTWRVRDIVDSFAQDLTFLDGLSDPSTWNVEALGTDAQGKPLRRPRLALCINVTSKHNLSIVIQPHVGDSGVPDFLPQIFYEHAPVSFVTPRGEIARIRDIGTLLYRNDAGPDEWSLIGSDLKALVTVAFEDLVTRLEARFEVVRIDTIVATTVGERWNQRVIALAVVDAEEAARQAQESMRLEAQRKAAEAAEEARKYRTAYLGKLGVDPVALAHLALTYDMPGTRRKDIIESFKEAGIRTEWGASLKHECDRLILAMDENRPGWRDAPYTPFRPADGGRQKPGRKPKPKVEPSGRGQAPKPLAEPAHTKARSDKGFNVHGLMGRVNAARVSRGLDPVPREQWPTDRRSAQPFIDEVRSATAR